MKYLVVCVALFLPVCAFAQAPPTPAPPAQKDSHTLEQVLWGKLQAATLEGSQCLAREADLRASVADADMKAGAAAKVAADAAAEKERDEAKAKAGKGQAQ